MRTFAACLITIAALTAACGPSQVSLDSRPEDADSGRDLAFSIAEQANCEDLEDFEVNSTNRWVFNCTVSGRTFTIEVFSDTTGRDAATRRMRDSRLPFRAGAHYVITDKVGGDPAARDALTVFPGDSAG